MQELQHVKSSYESRKKSGARYRKEAAMLQNAIAELRRQKRKNDKMFEDNSINESSGIENRSVLKEWFIKQYK